MPNIITLHACNDGSVSVSPWPENTDRMEVVPLMEYAALEARFVDWQRIMNDQLQRHRDEIRVIQSVVRELREDAARTESLHEAPGYADPFGQHEMGR